jgi:hypothetical protein
MKQNWTEIKNKLKHCSERDSVSVNIVAIIYCYQAADFACSVASSDGLLI